jgi:hypothetical protein
MRLPGLIFLAENSPEIIHGSELAVVSATRTPGGVPNCERKPTNNRPVLVLTVYSHSVFTING